MGIKKLYDEPITLDDIKQLELIEVQTGGGCTAYITIIAWDKVNKGVGAWPNRYLMITAIHGASIPETWLEPVTVCFYDDSKYAVCENWDCWESITFEEFVEVWYG